MATIYASYNLQCVKFDLFQLQILWLILTGLILQTNIYFVSLPLAIKKVYNSIVFRLCTSCLFFSYRPHCLAQFLKINVLDYNTFYYRNDDKPNIRLVFLHNLLSMIADVFYKLFLEYACFHIHCGLSNQSKSNKNLFRWICPLYSKSFQYLLGYNLIASEPPVRLSIPGRLRVAGMFN